MMRRGRREREEGFTLVEVMMAMMIFVTSIVIVMGIYGGIATMRESSRNMTRAMADARAVMEGLRNESVSGLAAVTAEDWTDWADTEGLNTLVNEVITVTFADEGDDPLDVVVQIDWEERGRDRTVTVNTLLTSR